MRASNGRQPRSATRAKSLVNIWSTLEPTSVDATRMKARSDLVIAIEHAVRQWDVTQAQAAKRLKITQSRLNDLLKGRIGEFNLDTLVKIATRAGLNVTLEIKNKAA